MSSTVVFMVRLSSTFAWPAFYIESGIPIWPWINAVLQAEDSSERSHRFSSRINVPIDSGESIGLARSHGLPSIMYASCKRSKTFADHFLLLFFLPLKQGDSKRIMSLGEAKRPPWQSARKRRRIADLDCSKAINQRTDRLVVFLLFISVAYLCIGPVDL